MTDWSELLEKHGRIVWKTVRRLLNNEADAMDCFQESFLAALELSRKQPVGNWPGLLKRVATVRALNQLQKNRRRCISPLQEPDSAEIACRSRSPSELASEQELFDQLRDGLAGLPLGQAEACCLRFLEGLSYEEIADHLDVSVNHVGVLLNRGKAALKKRLATFMPIEADWAETKAER